jgi:hypothetical protein
MTEDEILGIEWALRQSGCSVPDAVVAILSRKRTPKEKLKQPRGPTRLDQVLELATSNTVITAEDLVKHGIATCGTNANTLLSQACATGKIERLGRGCYTAIEE